MPRLSSRCTVLTAALFALAALGSAAVGDTDNAKNLVRVASAANGIVSAVPVKDGQAVKKGDVLVQLDDRVSQAQLDMAKAKCAACKENLAAAEKAQQEARARYRTNQEQRRQGTVAEQDIEAIKLIVEHAATQVVSDTQALKVAEASLRIAQLNLESCTIRSPVDGSVQHVLVKPGEAAKALEPAVMVRPGDAP